MSPTLIVLLVVAIAALLVSAILLARIFERRDIMQRATETFDTAGPAVLRPERERESRLRQRLDALAKSQEQNAEIQNKLVQGGFDSPTAPAMFFLIRSASFVLFPVIAWIAIPRTQYTLMLAAMATAVFIGFLTPIAVLDRAVRLRQTRITRSVPDALDLLVVCVEAGISLDAAILRVAKELRLAHPELAHELAVVNRLTNAGLPRETALRGLWQRTGVIDLRTLVSSMIQSEKWGTSIATVLRVAAETLRRKRRQSAEKRAKMAPLKMTFPLLLFILPPLFVVILGPAVVQIVQEFSKI